MSVTGLALASHACVPLIGTPGLAEPREWEGLRGFAELATASGFDGVDLSSGVFPLVADDKWWLSVRDVVTDHGLRVASVNSLRTSLCDPAFGEAGLQRALRALEVASLIGSDTMNLALGVPFERLDANRYMGVERPPGSSITATDADFRLSARRLDVLAARAEMVGVGLVLELHYNSIADTASSIDRLFELMERRIPVNPDLVNAVWSSAEPEDDWRRTLERLVPRSGGVWHVKNCLPRAGESMPVDAPLGAGVVDHAEALSILDAAGYTGWISVESCGAPDYVRVAQDGGSFLRTALDERREP